MTQSVFLFKSVLKQLLWESLTFVLLIDFCSSIEYSLKNLDFCGCFACRRICTGCCTKELIIVPFIMELLYELYSSFYSSMLVEHPVDGLFYQQKVRENKMVGQIVLSTNKTHEKDSLAVLNHSAKEAMTDSFHRECFP